MGMVDLTSRVLLGVSGASLRRTRLFGVSASPASSSVLGGAVAGPTSEITHHLACTIPHSAASGAQRVRLWLRLGRAATTPGQRLGAPPSDPSSPALWMDLFRTLPTPPVSGVTLTWHGCHRNGRAGQAVPGRLAERASYHRLATGD